MLKGLIGVMLAAALAVPAVAEVAVYTRGGVQVVSDRALGPQQRRGYQQFRQRARDFNGAFYVSTGSDDASWWVDEHRMEDAKSMAQRNCRIHARDKRAPCVLYAVIMPAAPARGSGKPITGINGSLSREIARRQGEGARGTWFVAAANRIGQFGVSWGQADRAKAREGALYSCINGIDRERFRDQITAPVYNDAVRAGKFDCRIVTEFRR